jgi:peptide/nickel transport system substrate-binding protein
VGHHQVIAFVAAFALLAANAATLRWSSQGDYLSSDPHAQNEGLNNNLNDEVFERLTSRGHDLKLRPRSRFPGKPGARRSGATTCARA